MPLQPAAEFPQREAFFYRKITCMRQRRIEERTDVAVREHKPIPLFPFRLLRIVFQDMKIESREDVSHIERPRSMPAPGCNEHADDCLSNLFRFFLERWRHESKYNLCACA